MRFTRIARHCAALVGVSVVAVALPANASAPDLATQKKIAAMSVPFVPNAGQWNERAAFAAQTFAGTLFVTKQGELVYSLPGKPVDAGAESVGAESAGLGSREATPSRRLPKPSERSPGWALTETLVDWKGHARPMRESTLKAPAGYRPMEGKVSYAIGNDAAKHTNNLNTYERVNLGDMYPGINVQLRATGNNVEKIFTVAPQQDPKQINIAVTGADKLEIGGSGELIAHTGNGPVTFTAPIAFQENVAGERVAVSVSYALNAEGRRYGFALGNYDRALPLVIDPLLQSTYFGGTNDDHAYALAIHPASGDVYIAGAAYSSDLPGSSGGAQPNLGGGADAFVARFDATLTQLLQTTYLGGVNRDSANGLAIHPTSGDVYLVGAATSVSFPGTNGGAQPTSAGFTDAFVARFSASLTTLIQTTFLGGSGTDAGQALAIDSTSGDIYVIGVTNSPDFPHADGGGQLLLGGANDGFVARLDASLKTLKQSTYLGGTGSESPFSVAVHPRTGDVVVAGQTNSADFPKTSGGAQSSIGGGEDAFVARFNSSLTALLQSSYVGGSETDAAYAMAISTKTGEVYVAGVTSSVDLPGAAGGAQSALLGGSDAFVMRLSEDLTLRLQSTFFGGVADETAYGIFVHPVTGEPYISGLTNSAGLPSVSGGVQTVKANAEDAFVARLNVALTAVVQSTFVGGDASDFANEIVLHPGSGEIYLSGKTASSNFPAALGGAQPTKSGGVNFNAFITRISANLAAAPATCNLDIDQDGHVTAATDGLMVLRRMLGLSGVALAAGAANPVGAQTDPEAMTNSINTMLASQLLDLDGSGGAPNAATDGLMLVRAMLGFTGSAVTNGAISGAPPRNTWPLIRDYLNQNCGSSFAP
jgi:hypothetical protein